MTRRAGYDRDGDPMSDRDVLSDDELAEDYARRRLDRRSRGGSDRLVRTLRRLQAQQRRAGVLEERGTR